MEIEIMNNPSTSEENSVQSLLVRQLNIEFSNSYVYRNFSGICDTLSLIGSTKWFKQQSCYELIHFNKIYDYICDRGMIPKLNGTPALDFDAVSLLNMFELATELEKNTTKNLIELKLKALADGDLVTADFIQWFLMEQIEEEKTVTDIRNRLRIVEGDQSGLILIDQELGE